MATGGGKTRDELMTKAAEYRQTAMEVNDAALTRAYFRMADEAEEKAKQLRPARPAGAPVVRRSEGWQGTR